MEIRLSEDLVAYIREQVAEGAFPSAENMVETALRQMRDRAERSARVRLSFLDDDAELLVGS